MGEGKVLPAFGSWAEAAAANAQRRIGDGSNRGAAAAVEAPAAGPGCVFPDHAEGCACAPRVSEAAAAVEAASSNWQARDAARLEVYRRRKAQGREHILSHAPTATRVIVAELERDECDMMTDYFATSIQETVLLSMTDKTREDFKRLRRAALLMPETAHLGPAAGKEVEHRENYSMGGGNYLKAGGSYSSGWVVCSKGIDWAADGIDRCICGWKNVPKGGA